MSTTHRIQLLALQVLAIVIVLFFILLSGLTRTASAQSLLVEASTSSVISVIAPLIDTSMFTSSEPASTTSSQTQTASTTSFHTATSSPSPESTPVIDNTTLSSGGSIPAYSEPTASDADTSVSATSTGTTTVMTRTNLTTQSGSVRNNPNRVSSDADVEEYIRGTLRNDTRITSIESSASAVSLSSENEPARLMGFIDVTTSVTVTAHADGSITISHPNAPFLVRPTFDDQLKATAEMLVGGITKGAHSLTPVLQAQIIAALQVAIGSMHF
jgi:hypothetical protein